MTRILGIDPGSLRTGFGVVESRGGRQHYVASGVIRLPRAALAERLCQIAAQVAELVAQYRPQAAAVEEVFFARDPKAALKLGQARGAAIVGLVQAGLPVAEYSPRTVKLAVVGTGAATKDQVNYMVVRLLGLPDAPSEDAADALAVALCHARSLEGPLVALARAARRPRRSAGGARR
ncbi:MAG: crossover junction endodeoxyribonuclease RuvC [Porticoccaceae bacterium]|nr:MAG: crossover junction endodeoxyribonuclease RuvC [Porticoccaceae bacterium]